MEKLNRKTTMCAPRQCLMLNRKQLDDSCMLTHYHICTKSTLHCTLNLVRSGGGGAGRGAC